MDTTIHTQLETLEAALIAAPCHEPFASPTWTLAVPEAPGVYVLWDVRAREPVYVGETACLRQRMIDFGRYRNHSARRKLAEQLRLAAGDEAGISAAIRERYVVSYLEVHLGRKELEEFLTLKWAGRLLNATTPRAHAPGRFHGVVPCAPRWTVSTPVGASGQASDRL